MWPVNPLTTTLASMRLLGPAARRFLMFSFLNNVSWQTLVGSVLVLHARALGMPPGTVGLMVAIMPLTLVLSLGMTAWVERIGPRRLMTAGWTARNLMAFPLVLTPWLYAVWGSGVACWALFAGVLSFCTLRSLTCTGWFPWLHEIIPATERGRYFSSEIILVQVVNVAIGLGTFFFLGRNAALWKFAALAGLGITAGLISISLMRRIPGGGPCVSRRPHRALLDLRLVLRDRAYLSFVLWTSLGFFVTVGQGTLTVLSMRDYLRIAPAWIMLTTSVGSAAAMLAGLWWGRLADRHGSGPVQVLAGTAMAVALGCFSQLREPAALALVMPVYAVCVASYSGFFVAANRGMLQRMRPRLRAGYSVVWQSLTSVAMGSSSVLIGLVIQRFGEPAFTTLPLAYAVLMAAAVLRYATLPEESLALASELRSQFNPAQPFISIMRACRYVLDPPELNPEPPPDPTRPSRGH